VVDSLKVLDPKRPIREALLKFNFGPGSAGAGGYMQFVVNVGVDYVDFVNADPATGYVAINANTNVYFSTESGVQTIGVVSAVPLPAALPLFATGLSALGVLGWRRKRKADALTA
jgi:hypothetical protein